jgi:predicted lipid carrier protein YhbT
VTDPTAEFFDAVGRRGHEPLLEHANGTLRVDLRDGRRTERWFVTVQKGDLTVSRRNTRADCIVSAERALFDRIVSGEANAFAALLREEMHVEGDVKLLVAFQRLLPGPRRRRRRAAAKAKA